MPEPTHELITVGSHFLPMLGTFIVTVCSSLAGLLPFLKWRDKKVKEKRAQEIAIAESDLGKLPKYIEESRFKEFEKNNEAAHGEVKKSVSALTEIVKEGLDEFGNTRQEVNSLRIEVGKVKATSETILKFVTPKGASGG